MSQNLKISWAVSMALLGGILLIFLLSRTNALYESGGEAAVSARIASFSVAVSEPILLSPDNRLDCNLEADEVTYSFDVTNHSELDVDYEVSFPGLSPNVSVDTGNGTGSLIPEGSETVQVTFTLIDPTDETQETDLSGVSALVRVVQKEVSP